MSLTTETRLFGATDSQRSMISYAALRTIVMDSEVIISASRSARILITHKRLPRPCSESETLRDVGTGYTAANARAAIPKRRATVHCDTVTRRYFMPYRPADLVIFVRADASIRPLLGPSAIYTDDLR